MWYTYLVTAPNLVTERGCLRGNNLLVRCFSRGRYRQRSNRLAYQQKVWRSQQEKVSGNKPTVYVSRSDTEKWTNPRQESDTLCRGLFCPRGTVLVLFQGLLYHTRNKNAICSKIAVNALYGVFCVSKGIYPLFSLSLLCGLATACKRQENSFSFTANLSINRVFHIGF